MGKHSKFIMLWVGIFIAVLVLIFFINSEPLNNDYRRYTSFSSGYFGGSLFFDTLEHMGYPVRRRYRAFDANNSSTDDVFIFISPRIDSASLQTTLDSMAEWVYSGGQMIFLHPNVATLSLFHETMGARGQLIPLPSMPPWSMYRFGSGEIILGNSAPVLNRALMITTSPGWALETHLRHWDANTIWFMEYYHGFQRQDTFFSTLPLIVQLILIQLILATIAAIIHFSRRFGNPIPYYEEVERDENEHVRALARLYMKTKRSQK